MELGTLLYRTWTFDKYGHYACSFWPWRFLRKIWPSSVFHKELFWKCWFYYWDYISCDVMRKRLDKIRWSSEKLALKRQHMCCCSLQSYYWLLFHSVDSRKGMKVFYGFSEILKIKIIESVIKAIGLSSSLFALCLILCCCCLPSCSSLWV